jgi:FkbM family methyltransferase
MPDLNNQLESLLSEEVAAAVQREQRAWDDLASPFGNSLVLFGAGNLGRKTLSGLRQIGIQPLAFADNNPQRWGTQMSDVPVLSPVDAAAQYGRSAAFVVTVWNAGQQHRTRTLQQQLQGLGCQRALTICPLFWKFPDIFLPFHALDLPHKVLGQKEQVRHVYRQLADEQSRREFVAQLKFRLRGDFDGMPDPVTGAQYWPHDIIVFQTDEHFVDCGAFDGDTIREIVRGKHVRIRKLTAFEPDPVNFERLRRFIRSLPENIQPLLTAHRAAVGNKTGSLRFNADASAGASVVRGGAPTGEGKVTAETIVEVQCVALDVILKDDTPTYIKMDIEGSELDALEGARNIINRHHPVLAICAYHVQDHLWRVPALIHAIWDQYRLYFRPHEREGWDLVCYAVPPQRLAHHP